MQGNVAIAHGAIAAGCRFFAGYPITPSSEIAEVLSKELPAVDGTFIQMEDEIASIGAVVGASIAGAKSMTATSGPGFSLKQENLGMAVMAEVPLVVVDVQRGGPSTGLPTKGSQGDVMQARWGTHGDHPIIAIAPSSVEECYDMTIRAFNLAEQYRTPVIILTDEIIAHLTEKIEIKPASKIELYNRGKPNVAPEKYLPYKLTESGIPPMANFGEGYRYHITGLVHDETGFPTNDEKEAHRQLMRLNTKFDQHMDSILDYEEINTKNMDLLLVSYGAPARSAKRAMKIMQKQGVNAGYLRLKTIWPFATDKIKKLSRKVDTIIVPEMNLGQIAGEIERYIPDNTEIIRVNHVNGEAIKPQEIVNAMIKKD
ncbi:MAG: 2-oxoacid:acceptor oxidoreductase subunit alpha [Candidatus Marinimicrobia bacterium]|nr:2-oxoacid:acceptor oxidoreductase subunit alpha [Candidatus Neomarinimicrobiota bacterium]